MSFLRRAPLEIVLALANMWVRHLAIIWRSSGQSDDGYPDHPHEAVPRRLGCIIALGRVTNEDRRHSLIRMSQA
jgi:hypothetical protein